MVKIGSRLLRFEVVVLEVKSRYEGFNLGGVFFTHR